MLRTTITTNRKACILALLPRILGGHAPAKLQKILVNVQSILAKSTDSSSNNHDAICEKCRQLIEMSFGPNNETPSTTEPSFNKPATHDICNPIQDIHKKHIKQNFIPNTDTKYESRNDKGRRVENNEDFNQPDNYRNKNIANVTSMNKTETQYLSNGGKQVQNIEGHEKSIESKKPNVEYIHEDPKVFENSTTERFITNFKQNPSQNSIDESKQYDSNAPKYWKNCNYSILKGNMYEKENSKQSYREGNINTAPLQNDRVSATTAKQNEEELVQKLEYIDETPVVEAPKVNTDGFNVNPKVLGETNFKTQVYTFSDNADRNSGAKAYEQSRLDELAKSCLDAPHNEIDDRLLKEMKKLGVPQTGHRGTGTPLMEDERIQMDVLKKPKKPVETTDMEVETSKYENKSEEYNDIRKLYPTYVSQSQELQEWRQKDMITLKPNQVANMPLEKINEDTTESEFAKMEPVWRVDVKPNFESNQILIDPYSKRITEEDYNNSAPFIKHQNSAMIQPRLPDNVVEPKKELDIARVPYTTAEALELRQHKLNLILNTDAIEPGQIVNNWIPEYEQEAAREWIKTKTEMAIEPQLPMSGENPYPGENQLNLNTQVDNPRTQINSGDRVSQSFEQPDQIMLNEEALKGAESTPTTPDESLTEIPFYDQNLTSNKEQSECNDQQKYPTGDSQKQVSHSFEEEQMKDPRNEETLKEQSHDDFTKKFAAMNLALDQEMSLSELLKRVRHRNRMEYCNSFILSSPEPKVDPVGKCGAPKKPPCPPPAPCCPAPPPPPPPCCPPPPPKCPKPCKTKCPPACPPPKKNPCDKYKKTCFDASYKNLLTLISTPSINHLKYTAMLLINFILRSDRVAICTGNAILSDEVVESLHSVGKMVSDQGLIETTQVEKGSHGLSFARDYEPWTPIPSWSNVKKEEKRPFICPKEGCKQFPPPRPNPPCNEKPCTNSPKRILSPIDLLSTRLDVKVYDYVEF